MEFGLKLAVVKVVSDLPQCVLVGAVDAVDRQHGGLQARRRTVAVDELMMMVVLKVLDGATSRHEPQQRPVTMVHGRRAGQRPRRAGPCRRRRRVTRGTDGSRR